MTINWSNRNQRAIEPWLCLLESMTGKERCRLEMHLKLSRPIHAFSKKGELLALATADRSTAVVDVRRGKIIAELKGDQGPVRGLAFGANVSTLFTAGSEGTVLIWDLHEQIAKAQKVAELSDGDVSRLWTELANPDTIKAYQALDSLLAGSDKVVSFLADKLKPARKVPAREIDLLIAELGSEAFKTRQLATRLLLEILPQSKAALTRSLENNLPLEHHLRIARLVAEFRRREVASEHLRELRAIEILEAIATPQARRIIRSLATGHPAARLTDEAAAAIERMAP
jgi:hypothetical protein